MKNKHMTFVVALDRDYSTAGQVRAEMDEVVGAINADGGVITAISQMMTSPRDLLVTIVYTV